jgi:hypothetical protein
MVRRGNCWSRNLAAKNVHTLAQYVTELILLVPEYHFLADFCMHFTSSSARLFLVFASCCTIIVVCALMSPGRNSNMQQCPNCPPSLAQSDESIVAAAKANIELEAAARHRKIQDAMDNAEAQGDAIATRMRTEAAAFLQRMRTKANHTIFDSSLHSSSSALTPHFLFVLIASSFIFVLR